MKRLAIVPGSFDPLTRAHMEIINRARTLYDKVIVLVCTNASKSHMFTQSERVALIQDTITKSGWDKSDRLGTVDVDSTEGLVTNFAMGFVNLYDIIDIVRGIRPGNASEEASLAQVYQEDWGIIDQRLHTTFFPVSQTLTNISSTRVRNYIRVKNWDNVVHCCGVGVCNQIRKMK